MNLGPTLAKLKGQVSGLAGKLPFGRSGSSAGSGGSAGDAGGPAMPAFLTDAVNDLRAQGLLPVVVILIVALPVSAVVFGTTGGSYSPPASAGAAVSSEPDSGSLVVVADRPGLRDHGDRFRDRTPRDPFAGLAPVAQPAFPVPDPALSEPGGAEPRSPDPGGGLPGPSGIDSPSTERPDFGGGSGGGTSTGSTGVTTPPSGITDVRVETEYIFTHTQARLRFGLAGSGDLRDLDHLPRLAGLPLRRPVVFYLGASVVHQAALFSVSPEVVEMSGEGMCAGGTVLRCHFLLLRPGDAVNLFDGARMKTWRLALSSIDVIEREVDLIEEIISRRGDDAGGGKDGGNAASDDPRDRPISNG